MKHLSEIPYKPPTKDDLDEAIGYPKEENALLNRNYWDCECDINYIKPKSLKQCEECGYSHDECPDSRESEVRGFYEMEDIQTGK